MMTHNEILRKIAPDSYRKLYVQRDYSHGLTVAFSTEFPAGLENKVRLSSFQSYFKVYILRQKTKILEEFYIFCLYLSFIFYLKLFNFLCFYVYKF